MGCELKGQGLKVLPFFCVHALGQKMDIPVNGQKRTLKKSQRHDRDGSKESLLIMQ